MPSIIQICRKDDEKYPGKDDKWIGSFQSSDARTMNAATNVSFDSVKREMATSKTSIPFVTPCEEAA